MRIEVTQQDIDLGRCRDPDRCALALAIGRALGRSASVTYGNVWPSLASHECIAKLPLKARAFIARFDVGGQVEPFAFELELFEGGGARPQGAPC